MVRSTRRTVGIVVSASLAAVVLVAILSALDGLYGRARWLTVRAPVYGVVGRTLPVTITLKAVHTPTYLAADLHWEDRARRSHGYLSGDRRLVRAAGTYTFDLPVNDRAQLAFVVAVVYLSPTGGWGERQRLAVTRPIRVRAGDPSGAPPRVVTVPAYEGREQPAASEGAPPIAGRFGIGLLLAVAALGSARAAAAGSNRRERAAWVAATLGLLAATLWEVFALGSVASQIGRVIAAENHLYAFRRPWQRAADVLLCGAGAAAAALVMRAVRLPAVRLTLVGMICYVVVSALDLLSLHSFDAFAHRLVGPVSVIQILKGGSALLIALGAAGTVRSRTAGARASRDRGAGVGAGGAQANEQTKAHESAQ